MLRFFYVCGGGSLIYFVNRLAHGKRQTMKARQAVP